jgi:inner membrane protein COX18
MLPLRRPPSILRPQSIFRRSTQYSLLHPQRVRQFHASPRRHGALDILLSVPHDFMVTLHSSGLSWAAVIPITAITIRCLVVPFLIAPARRERQKMAELAPMISANALLLRDHVEQQIIEKPQIVAKRSPQALYKDTLKNMTNSKIRDFNIGRYTGFRTLLQIPVFLVVIEALRRMMGMERGGLLSLLSRKDAPKNIETSTIPSGTDVPAILQTESAVSETSSWYEPSMTVEGPFSIVDLTAPDPTLCLPFIVSGLMFANLRYGMRRKKDLTKSKLSRRLQNGMLGVAFLIAPLTLHLPAGFLYYWACTSASSLTADILLDLLFPHRPAVTPCRRPLPSMGKKAHVSQRGMPL